METLLCLMYRFTFTKHSIIIILLKHYILLAIYGIIMIKIFRKVIP